MFENKKTQKGIEYSRYIASWNNMGGTHYYGCQFAEWLKANGVTDEEVHEIREMAACGKMELEVSAMRFINKQKKAIKQIDAGEEPEWEP